MGIDKRSLCNFSFYATGKCMDVSLGLHAEVLLAQPWKLKTKKATCRRRRRGRRKRENTPIAHYPLGIEAKIKT